MEVGQNSRFHSYFSRALKLVAAREPLSAKLALPFAHACLLFTTEKAAAQVDFIYYFQYHRIIWQLAFLIHTTNAINSAYNEYILPWQIAPDCWDILSGQDHGGYGGLFVSVYQGISMYVIHIVYFQLAKISIIYSCLAQNSPSNAFSNSATLPPVLAATHPSAFSTISSQTSFSSASFRFRYTIAHRVANTSSWSVYVAGS